MAYLNHPHAVTEKPSFAGSSLRGERAQEKTSSCDRSTPLLAGDVLDLLERSRESLLQACHAETATQRYHDATMGALRVCAAVLAQCAPRAVGSRPRNAWETLSHTVPELGEWASFFQHAAKRSRSLTAGLGHVDQREADDLVREAEAFLGVALVRLGLPPMAPVSQDITPVYRAVGETHTPTFRGQNR